MEFLHPILCGIVTVTCGVLMFYLATLADIFAWYNNATVNPSSDKGQILQQLLYF